MLKVLMKLFQIAMKLVFLFHFSVSCREEGAICCKIFAIAGDIKIQDSLANLFRAQIRMLAFKKKKFLESVNDSFNRHNPAANGQLF